MMIRLLALLALIWSALRCAWVNPGTRVTGDLITSSIYNTDIIGNLLALKVGPTDFETVNNGTDYSSSSTSFVDVDADLSCTITSTGGWVLCHFHGTVKVSSTSAAQVRVYFDLQVDGARDGGDTGYIVAVGRDSTNDYEQVRTISFTRLLLLAAGAHTVDLQWKVTASAGTPTVVMYAGAGTADYDVHPQMWLREL